MLPEFQPFPKIARLNRTVVVTEKIDGTNAQVLVRPADSEADPLYETLVPEQQLLVSAGSRSRWLTHGGKGDNFGFGEWVRKNSYELAKLGPGTHYGEWWGLGIQRGYGIYERRFSLFNTSRWDAATLPSCCSVVPVLAVLDGYDGITGCLDRLHQGSVAAPGFSPAEGLIVYHAASRQYYKVTLTNDSQSKGQQS